jgi:replication-associated recombination protein RarA
MESSRAFSIIPFGAPGSGKSNLCNILVGQPGKFKASKTAASGETKKISFCEAPAFGK